MTSVAILVLVAGCIQLAIALMNPVLPKLFDYRTNLARLSPIVRQIFVVHSVYIALVLVIFGLLCLLHPLEMTSGQPMARFLNGCLAVFWGLRLAIQLFYYDAEVLRRHRLAMTLLTLAVVFLTSVFGFVTTLGSGG